LSQRNQKANKSFADQLRRAWEALQKKSSDTPRRFESEAQTDSITPSTTGQQQDTGQPVIPPHPVTPAPTRQVTPVVESSTAPRPQERVVARSDTRIVWGDEQDKKPPVKPTTSPTTTRSIDWGGINSSGQADPSTLVGVEDAFDHTPLLPGERVAFCNKDKVAYHLATWEFLRLQNQGRCCICGLSTSVSIITLPGTYVPPLPVVVPVFRPEVQVRPGEKIISLKEVPYHINLAVIVQDYVHKVHRSQKGTYFIRFEPLRYGEPVYSGFKAVIFNNYVDRWSAVGTSIESYARKNIRVRGIVQKHETWGIEILVNSPHMIEVINS
jgi:hypothetical protein